MNEDILIRLKSLGVSVPICQNCKSEEFEAYTVWDGKVINCDKCNFAFQATDVRRNQGTAPTPGNSPDAVPAVRS